MARPLRIEFAGGYYISAQSPRFSRAFARTESLRFKNENAWMQLMPKTPSDDETGFYHVVIPLDPLHEAGGELEFDARPVTEERANELIRLFQHIGRNQPCPCGSGAKFKRCCLRRAS